MAVQTQVRQVGDTKTAISAQLKRPDGTVVDVTSLTVKFAMYEEDGTAKVTETSDNVSKDDATNGKVSYAPQSADVNTPGVYHAYFITEDGSSNQDTFPAKRGDYVVDIQRVGYSESDP